MTTSTLPEAVIEVTQFLSTGKTKQVYAIVGEDYVMKSRGMIFSAEVSKIGVVFCGRRQNESRQVQEISLNQAGFEGAKAALRKVIDRLSEGRRR